MLRRIEVFASLPGRLIQLYGDPVRLGPRILADAGEVPAHHASGHRARYGEAAGELAAYVEVRHRRANRGQLLALVAVEGREPVRHGHACRSGRVGGYPARINIQHVRALDERVLQDAVGRIERVVDAE